MFSNLSGHKQARKLADRLADIICPNCSESDRNELTIAIMGYSIIPAIMSQLKDMAHDAEPSRQKELKSLYDDLQTYGKHSDAWSELRNELKQLSAN